MLSWLARLSRGDRSKPRRRAANALQSETETNNPSGDYHGFEHFTAIIAAMKVAKEIVFFTGAGVSAESGIPTFRDGATSLWNKVDPDKVASIRALEANPGRVWDWHANLKKNIDARKPNSGHVAIAEFSRLLENKRFTVITQNIDGYHQQAGVDRVFELHGSIHRLRCHRHCSHYELWHDSTTHPENCPNCGALIRPDVVLFGESLNEDLLSFAEAAARNADVFFSIGTSSSVQPAAGLPVMAKQVGALVVEVNPNETSFSELADYSVRSSAGQFLPELLAEYRQRS